MKHWIDNALIALWYRRPAPWWLWLLSPLSGIYRTIVAIRARYHRSRTTETAPLPVIVVGNLSVGGTGKTPLTLALVSFLTRLGYRPGVISRGYGAKPPGFPFWVTPETTAAESGDEPLLIAQKAQCPVVIDPQRNRGVGALCQSGRCDVILSDDGLQHYAMARDVEIVVIDGERRFGNGFCLPIGPLREPLNRLQSVTFTVCNGGVAAPGEIQMKLQMVRAHQLTTQRACALTDFIGRTVFACAGIGHPERFFRQLRSLGLTVQERPFPDHHRFCPTDFAFSTAADDVILLTEKDAIKMTEWGDDRFWVVPVDAQLPPEFLTEVVSHLRRPGQNLRGGAP